MCSLCRAYHHGELVSPSQEPGKSEAQAGSAHGQPWDGLIPPK